MADGDKGAAAPLETRLKPKPIGAIVDAHTSAAELSACLAFCDNPGTDKVRKSQVIAALQKAYMTPKVSVMGRLQAVSAPFTEIVIEGVGGDGNVGAAIEQTVSQIFRPKRRVHVHPVVGRDGLKIWTGYGVSAQTLGKTGDLYQLVLTDETAHNTFSLNLHSNSTGILYTYNPELSPHRIEDTETGGFRSWLKQYCGEELRDTIGLFIGRFPDLSHIHPLGQLHVIPYAYSPQAGWAPAADTKPVKLALNGISEEIRLAGQELRVALRSKEKTPGGDAYRAQLMPKQPDGRLYEHLKVETEPQGFVLIGLQRHERSPGFAQLLSPDRWSEFRLGFTEAGMVRQCSFERVAVYYVDTNTIIPGANIHGLVPSDEIGDDERNTVPEFGLSSDGYGGFVGGGKLSVTEIMSGERRFACFYRDIGKAYEPVCFVPARNRNDTSGLKRVLKLLELDKLSLLTREPIEATQELVEDWQNANLTQLNSSLLSTQEALRRMAANGTDDAPELFTWGPLLVAWVGAK